MKDEPQCNSEQSEKRLVVHLAIPLVSTYQQICEQDDLLLSLSQEQGLQTIGYGSGIAVQLSTAYHQIYHEQLCSLWQVYTKLNHVVPHSLMSIPSS